LLTFFRLQEDSVPNEIMHYVMMDLRELGERVKIAFEMQKSNFERGENEKEDGEELGELGDLSLGTGYKFDRRASQ